MTTATDELLTAKQVAERLKISEQTVRTITKQGRIHCVQADWAKGARYRASDISKFIDGLEVTK